MVSMKFKSGSRATATKQVEGLREPHEMELLLDRERVKSFTVAPPNGDKNFEKVDAHLKVRVPVTAGPHQLGVTFVKNPSSLLETKRQPYQARFNMHRHPRLSPAIYQVSINGPYDAKGPGDTPSRRRIFVSQPTKPADEDQSRRAHPLHADAPRLSAACDAAPISQKPMEFYRKAQGGGRFRSGHRSGVERDAGQSGIPFSHRAGPGGCRAERRLSHQRSGAGVAAFVFPLEQHPG